MVIRLTYEIFSEETIEKNAELFRRIRGITLTEYGQHLESLLNDSSFLIALNVKGDPVGFIRFDKPKQGDKELETLRTFRTIPEQLIAHRMTTALGIWARSQGFERVVRKFQSKRMLKLARNQKKIAEKHRKGPYRRVQINYRTTKVVMHLRRPR